MTTPASPTARERAPLAMLCLVAMLFAAVVHVLLFAHGSLNNDEVPYLLQAKAISHGHLFIDVPQPVEAHQVWFFVQRDVGFVSKYLPLVSAVYAVGLLLTGSIVPILALMAGALPLLVHALALEVGLPRRHALLAAALVALSPVVVMESALPLSYLLFLVLVTACWLLLARLGHGRSGAGEVAALGLAASAAACVRPYDAVLLVVPGLVWVARRRRSRVRLTGALVLGALPLTVAVAVYDTVVSGRPWTPPFSLLEPADTVGFGVRRLFPADGAHHFGPLQGLAGLAVHFGIGLLTWTAFGLLLVPAAVAAWRSSRSGGSPGRADRSPSRPAGPPDRSDGGSATRMLLGTSAVHIVGYWFFWGPWLMSILWGGTRVLGPAYAMPLVVPVVIAGLPVAARWWTERRRTMRWLVALAGVVAVAQLGFALGQATIDAGRTRRVLAAASRARDGGPLLLDTDPPYLGHPVSHLVDGTALAATNPVPDPGGPPPRLLQLPRAVYGSGTLSYVVTRQQRVEAATVAVAPQLVGRRGDVLVVERGGRTTACPLAGARVVVTPGGTSGCEGTAVPEKWTKLVYRRCPDTSCLVLAVYRRSSSGKLGRVGWRQLPVRSTPVSVALLVDADPLEHSGNGWVRVPLAVR